MRGYLEGIFKLGLDGLRIVDKSGQADSVKYLQRK